MLAIDKSRELSDEKLVVLALTDRNFFSIIVERFEAKLIRYIKRLGIHIHEDRQDILQEIFIKVYKNLNGFDTQLSFSSWIYRIAHNEAISWFRKQKARPEGHLVGEATELFSYIPDTNQSAEQLLEATIDAQYLQIALNALDTKYRGPLILRFFEHKEYDEISDILKIPIGTVGTLIARGKKKLKETIPHKQTD